jgi:hypothetical protein
MNVTLPKCPQCGYSVSKTASNCPGCGAILRDMSSKALSVFLSFLIPGLGQIYQGRVLCGIFFFMSTIIVSAITCGVLGPVFWIWGIIETWRYEPTSIAK